MRSIAFAAPALPAGVEQLEGTATEVLGPRRRELDDFHNRLGITKEHWYLQQTAEGPVVLVFLEGTDLAATFEKLAVSDHPFDRWFRDRAQKVHGIDFSAPMPGPMPEQVLAIDRT